MIRTLWYLEASDTVPYDNLALEEYLLETVQPGECILYLWQNRRTVVIGKNQDAWNECKVEALEADGGYLARRPSGGGAVYHDLGNLNFTFVAVGEDYSVDRQLEVLLAAVFELGIHAEKSGRNDVTIEGRKFSGNAFSQKGNKHCHHGTIMINVDKESLSHYLKVSAEKLKTKQVASVRSRVCNLNEYCPELTVDDIKSKMRSAFRHIYGLPIQEMRDVPGRLDWSRIEELRKKFASWDWNYGRKVKADSRFQKRFAWGGLDIQIIVYEGKIEDIVLYSDALEVEYIEKMRNVILSTPYTSKALVERMETSEPKGPIQRQMQLDMVQWMAEWFE